MLKIEIIGNQEVIAATLPEIESLAAGSVQQFRHRGLAGEAGLVGLIVPLLPVVLPHLFALLKSLSASDRTLKASVNGFEFVVRDVSELSDLLEVLETRGIIPGK